MFEILYNWSDEYTNGSGHESIAMSQDSDWFAFSEDNIEKSVEPETIRKEYETD